jgi:glucose-6-phosphate 1-dehydrogenase
MSEPLPPALFVIFGATGDLARRKLLPALGALRSRGELPERFVVLGVARDPFPDDEAFRGVAHDALAGLNADQIQYQTIGEGTPADFARIAADVNALDREHNLGGNRVFYLALPPQAFQATVDGISGAGLARSAGFTRIVVEKPFGHDLASARELNAVLHRHFDESQIFRIDHYLGKETVRNLMVFRFANPIFETQWHRGRIEHVEISVAEPGGVGTRAAYYERAGAVRDMVQNHLTQLLCLIAMEPPQSLDAEAGRDAKRAVLEAMERVTAADAVFGQYEGYLEEPGVDRASRTETFAAIRVRIDNDRWRGVPFELRTGKKLKARSTRIVVRFRPAPAQHMLAAAGCQTDTNVLTIFLQPDEGFSLTFDVKEPGERMRVQHRALDFYYREAFGPLAEAYETLIGDVLQGDQSLFVRSDWVERSWHLYQPLLESPPPPVRYSPGTWGA